MAALNQHIDRRIWNGDTDTDAQYYVTNDQRNDN